MTILIMLENSNFNPFSKKKKLGSSKLKETAAAILNLIKMVDCSPEGYKTLWKMEKLIITSNFSFSHSVFKRLVLQSHKNISLLFWERANHYLLLYQFQTLTNDYQLSKLHSTEFHVWN